MAQTAHRLPSATGLTDNTWTNPSNALTNTSDFTTTSTLNNKQDYYNFGIEQIPPDATIEGIEVKLKVLVNGSTGSLNNDTVDIDVDISHNNGTNYTAAKTEQFTDLSDDFGDPIEDYKAFGGVDDTWGRSWTPSEFLDGAFMARIEYAARTGTSTPSVYWIAVTVYYSRVELVDGLRKKVVLTASSNSGYIQSKSTPPVSGDNDYYFNRTPWGANLSTGNGLRVGFRNKNSSPSLGNEYQAAWESFIEFDTSDIPDTARITSAYFRMFSDTGEYLSDSFNIVLIKADHGASLTTADWLDPNDLASSDQVGYLDSLLFSSGENQLLSTNELTPYIDKAGTTRFALVTDDQINANYPFDASDTDSDFYPYFHLTNYDGSLLSRPELVIEYEEEVSSTSLPREKDYIVKFYDKDLNYIGPLGSVVSIPTIRDEINTLGGNITIELGITRDEIPEELDIGAVLAIIEIDDIFPNGITVFEGQVYEVQAPDGATQSNVKVSMESTIARADNDMLSKPYIDDSVVVGNLSSGDYEFDFSGSDNLRASPFEYTSDGKIVGIALIEQRPSLGAVSIYDSVAGKPNQEIARFEGSELYVTTDTEVYIDKAGISYDYLVQTTVGRLAEPVTIKANKLYYLVFEGGDTSTAIKVDSNSGYASTDGGTTWASSSVTPAYFTVDFGDETTTLEYTGTAPGVMLIDVLQKYKAIGGNIEFDGGSVLYTNQALDYEFKDMSYAQAIMTIIKMLPPYYYAVVDFSTRKVVIRKRSDLADIYIDYNLNIQRLDETINDSSLHNVAYVSGADDGTGANLYKKYTNEASVRKYGRYAKPINDPGIISNVTAKAMALKAITEGGDRNLSVSAELKDTPVEFGFGYAIEQIRPGMMVAPINVGVVGQQKMDHQLFDDQWFDYKLHDPNSYCLVVHSIELGRNGLRMILGAPRQELDLEDQSTTKKTVQKIVSKTNPSRPT